LVRSKNRRVALFGGSFNPPHVGHLLSVVYVQAVADVDAVWLMPAVHHPFGKQLTPFGDRVALCRALTTTIEGASVIEVEAEEGLDGRTIHTLQRLLQQYPDHEFSLMVGADIVSEWHKWFEFERLAMLARPIVLGRSGYATERPSSGPLQNALFLWEVLMPEVSSTDIRRRLAAGLPVNHLVPRAVLREIETRKLYVPRSPEP
jgi:nicotinate-nucleotide adenylyltransferase